VREQWHFRRVADGYDVWDVAKLTRLVEHVPVEQIPLSNIADIDREYWFDHGVAPTVRNVVEHFKLLQAVDLSFPIVVDPDGHVMDGMHRVARALLEGRESIAAKRLTELPAPDIEQYQLEDRRQ
jgi:hypothetical protein